MNTIIKRTKVRHTILIFYFLLPYLIMRIAQLYP
ncbi:Uncharacterised protein [Salmonella enterica subsp. enterica]|uniref:Uncharacterized protein n=1 Tax=Salmonella enterica I TaxID=59201 RepID=A0A379WK69_SALET|nr:Uncharacterised protein [Salmonella enterica subsp. enterica]